MATIYMDMACKATILTANTKKIRVCWDTKSGTRATDSARGQTPVKLFFLFSAYKSRRTVARLAKNERGQIFLLGVGYGGWGWGVFSLSSTGGGGAEKTFRGGGEYIEFSLKTWLTGGGHGPRPLPP